MEAMQYFATARFIIVELTERSLEVWFHTRYP